MRRHKVVIYADCSELTCAALNRVKKKYKRSRSGKLKLKQNNFSLDHQARVKLKKRVGGPDQRSGNVLN